MDELIAARKLIAAQDSELKAGKEAADALRTRIKLLAETNQAQTEQIENLKTALTSREQQVKELQGLVDKFQLRVQVLEKARSRGRKLTIAAFIGGLAVGATATR